MPQKFSGGTVTCAEPETLQSQFYKLGVVNDCARASNQVHVTLSLHKDSTRHVQL